jgi:hypothetical protein
MKTDHERTAGPRAAKSSSAKPRPTKPSGSLPIRMQKRMRDTKELASTLEEAADEVGHFVRTQAERRPYVSAATATGVGYILGGGAPSRLLGIFFGLGSRFAIEMFLRELVGGPARAGNTRAATPTPHRSAS